MDDEDEAVQGLVDLGLVTDEVSWDTRARHARRDVLAAACRRLGARRSGTRDALEARVLGSTDWDDASWVRVAHPALVLRLERWATLQVRPDRSAPVLERMGRTRWPPYVPTGGAPVPSRAHWDRWEALVEGWATMELETAFDALSGCLASRTARSASGSSAPWWRWRRSWRRWGRGRMRLRSTVGSCMRWTAPGVHGGSDWRGAPSAQMPARRWPCCVRREGGSKDQVASA